MPSSFYFTRHIFFVIQEPTRTCMFSVKTNFFFPPSLLVVRGFFLVIRDFILFMVNFITSILWEWMPLLVIIYGKKRKKIYGCDVFSICIIYPVYGIMVNVQNVFFFNICVLLNITLHWSFFCVNMTSKCLSYLLHFIKCKIKPNDIRHKGHFTLR